MDTNKPVPPTDFPHTERTRVTRKPDRGSYDRELVSSILDQAFVCSIAFIVDGLPIVVPTNYVRVGDKLYLHGSTASRLMKTLVSGAPFTINVTLLDGIVFSPTATGHSVNYRSVVVMGKAEVIEGHDAKLAAMRDFVEYVLKGRWADVRPPTEQELKGTIRSWRFRSSKLRRKFAQDSPSTTPRNTKGRSGPAFCLSSGLRANRCAIRAAIRTRRYRRT